MQCLACDGGATTDSWKKTHLDQKMKTVELLGAMSPAVSLGLDSESDCWGDVW